MRSQLYGGKIVDIFGQYGHIRFIKYTKQEMQLANPSITIGYWSYISNKVLFPLILNFDKTCTVSELHLYSIYDRIPSSNIMLHTRPRVFPLASFLFPDVFRQESRFRYCGCQEFLLLFCLWRQMHCFAICNPSCMQKIA